MTGLETLALGAIFKTLAPASLAAVGKTVKQKSDQVRARFESTFQDHLLTTLKRCQNVSTIFTADASVPLKSIYTNLYIEKGDKRIRDDDILENLNILGDIIVHGTGGAGKTMLMKYLSLNSIEYPQGKIPLFIELRNLPDHDPKHFYRALFEYCTPHRQKGNFALFEAGLSHGMFLIFFDGLDEVKASQREDVYSSIRKIASDFPDIRVVASTRPEIDTRNWGELSSYRVLGMTLEQAQNLIRKIDFPEELKTNFLKLLDDSFYEKHESFLSVPLLCSLMLFTYHEFQEIPSRVTVFYDQAFETLFRKHDRRKEGYFNREFSCNLGADRFRRLFSAFCYRTLALDKLSFTDDEILHHISRAAAASEIDVDAEDFAKDLVSCVCVIMRDGLNLHFIHRSFQEYFAAQFLLRYRGDDVFEVFNRVIGGPRTNDVALMAADMDLQIFEREWALPALTEVMETLRSNRRESWPKVFIEMSSHSLRISGDPPANINSWSWTADKQRARDFLEAIGKVYYSVENEKYFWVRPITYSGHYARGASLCDMRDIGVRLPKAISDACDRGHVDPDEFGREFIEFVLEDGPFEWLKHTTFYADLEQAVQFIEELEGVVSERVKKRDELDLLS